MSQENVEVVKRVIQAVNERDLDGLLAVCDPEVEFHALTRWPGEPRVAAARPERLAASGRAGCVGFVGREAGWSDTSTRRLPDSIPAVGLAARELMRRALLGGNL